MSDKKQRDFLDLTSLQLRARPPEGANRPATLAIKTWSNKISMTVFSNVQSLPRYGIFGLNLYPYQFSSVLTAFRNLLDKPFTGEKSTIKMRFFDKATQDKKHLGDVAFGRDQEGIPYICVISPQSDYPKIVFRIEPNGQMEYVDMDRAQAATIHAQGFVNFWMSIINDYLMANFIDESNNKGGGNRGGYNNNNSNNSSSNSNLQEDDLPF